MDYEATEKGVLAKIINEGTTALPVGEPVAVFTKKKEDVGKFSDFILSASSGSQSQPSSKAPEPQQTQTQAPSTISQTPSTLSSGERVFASPLAKTVAQQKGINLTEVQGSGPNGRILKQDVESFQPRSVQQQQPVV
jgi:pyruvate dehydrogenase E2 component (dihydrolipoamide acetyltransferase)